MIFQDGGRLPSWIFKFKKNYTRRELFSDFASLYRISRKSDNTLSNYDQKRFFYKMVLSGILSWL